METVIKEHNLDIETLMSSRLPMASGTQIGDSASQQLTGTIFIFLQPEKHLLCEATCTNWCKAIEQ